MGTHSFAPLQRVVEAEMVDACRITRDRPGTDDDTLDQTTGLLTPPGSDASTVYEGACMIYKTALRPALDSEGRTTITEQAYTLRLPLSATVPNVGDSGVMTASVRDASLVNRPFRVQWIDESTFAVSRDMLVEIRERL